VTPNEPAPAATTTPLPERRALRRTPWTLHVLIGAALLGGAALFALARWLAEPQQLVADWREGAGGRIELAAANGGPLAAYTGRPLVALGTPGRRVEFADALALQRAPRWMIDDAARERHRQLHTQVSAVLAEPDARLHFGDGSQVDAPLQRLSLEGLGGVFWLISTIALLLFLSAAMMLLAKTSAHNLLYAAMALSQAGNLVFIAAASTPRFGLPAAVAAWDMPVRMSLDLATAAAAAHLCSLYAPRVPAAATLARLGWAFAAVLIALEWLGWLPGSWWWAQLGVFALGVTGIAILRASYRIEAHPLVLQMQRFGLVIVASWAVLTLSLALTDRMTGVPNPLTGVVSMIWYVFLASLLLLAPFFARSHQVLREFSLLAAVSTVATSLDLLFVAVFSFGRLAALMLALSIALAAYAAARHWILDRLRNRNMQTTERMFEQLYRSAREVEAQPERAPELLMELLREYFEPTAAELGSGRLPAAQVEDHGAALAVPVPALAIDTPDAAASTSIHLRHAEHGLRRFTFEDARLADRIVEQLRRAVAFDHAVEQGRNEERSRIAQDLHDDIGARLLTLMYKVQSPELEEYVRHTLKDLKTLTRGLATGNHRLSHAAAEWKADLTQRLTAADIALGWNFAAERDAALNVVEWSALTRILRELASNAIAHAGASRIDISLQLDGRGLELEVIDDGRGREPDRWSHGLGLGGVRKRVKQLGGEVEWREVRPSGIRCRVRIPVDAAGR